MLPGAVEHPPERPPVGGSLEVVVSGPVRRPWPCGSGCQEPPGRPPGPLRGDCPGQRRAGCA
eukprot:5505612-Heterocapsa_arctica.AAC.1